MKMVDVKIHKNVYLVIIIVLNVMKKGIYAKFVKMGIIQMTMVDALILIIVRFHLKVNVLNAKRIIS